MKSMYRSLFLIFLCQILLQSCAQTGALTGGDKDTTPPELDTLRSTANQQLRFVKQPIELTFKEWIKLEDISKQVVVSPPLRETPDVKLKGKTVVFKFADSEILRENATYSINFGDAIRDITEGNKAKMRFVFATGNQIDSLRVRAQVVNTSTDEPIENALFMLYDNVVDSAFRTERPFYFAKTDKSGSATIENVRKGRYRMVSLSDLNANYILDQPTEKLGFYPRLVDISDTTKQVFQIRHFEQKLALKIKNKETNRYGQLKIAYNQSIEKVVIGAFPKPNIFQYFVDNDTLRVWYGDAANRWTLIADKDSIDVRTPNKDVFLRTQHPQLVGFSKIIKDQAPPLVNAFLGKPHSIETSVPIEGINTQYIQIQEDTLLKYLNPSIKKDSLNPRKLLLNAAFIADKKYRVTVFPNALTDIYGKLNKDTLVQQVYIQGKKTLGTMTLTLKKMNKTQAYIVQLLTKDGIQIEEKILNSGTQTSKIMFAALVPNEYKLRIILDDNKNGRWDTGDYDAQRQPEQILMRPIEQAVRADWDVEAEIELQ